VFALLLFASFLVASDPVIAEAIRALDGGRPQEARVALERVVTRSPGNLEAWALLARAHWLLQDPAKSSAAAKRADLPTASPETLHTLALYYAQSGNRKRAAELEGKYALTAQADAAAPARAALLSFEVGDLNAAIRFGEMANRKQPLPEVTAMLAKAFEARKDYDKSLPMYEQLVRMRPQDEESYSQAGQAFLRAGRFSDAVRLLEDGVSKFENSAQLQLALGVAYYGQRRFDDAGQRFLRTIDIDPTVQQPYVFLAEMIDQLEPMWSAIEAEFRMWYERDPRGFLPPYVLARLVIARGDPGGQAEPLLRQSVERNANYGQAHFELGGILERRRQWAEAAAEYEISAKLNPKLAEPHYRLARVYARLNQPQKAAQARARHQQLSSPSGAGMSPDRK
jgi:tetratricopeptide (TPR) repeat protein